MSDQSESEPTQRIKAHGGPPLHTAAKIDPGLVVLSHKILPMSIENQIFVEIHLAEGCDESQRNGG